ncbi:MAG: hypothetical protein ABFD98_18185 [Syntrophobacteraceae bacterium]|nr:hypothetical protein [Desulfobacteraceae bacterium]
MNMKYSIINRLYVLALLLALAVLITPSGARAATYPLGLPDPGAVGQAADEAGGYIYPVSYAGGVVPVLQTAWGVGFGWAPGYYGWGPGYYGGPEFYFGIAPDYYVGYPYWHRGWDGGWHHRHRYHRWHYRH